MSANLLKNEQFLKKHSYNKANWNRYRHNIVHDTLVFILSTISKIVEFENFSDFQMICKTKSGNTCENLIAYIGIFW